MKKYLEKMGHDSSLTCTSFGEKCKPFNTDDLLHFRLITEDDVYFNYSWDSDVDSREGQLSSSTIYLNEDIIKEPYHRVPGVLDTVKGHSFDLPLEGSNTFSWKEKKEGLEKGLLTKEFPIKEITPIPMVRESHAINGNVKMIIQFGPSEEERWLISVTGNEDHPYNILNPKLKAIKKEKLPYTLTLDWNMVGEFTIKKIKKIRRYNSGTVKTASVLCDLLFDYDDLSV